MKGLPVTRFQHFIKTQLNAPRKYLLAALQRTSLIWRHNMERFNQPVTSWRVRKCHTWRTRLRGWLRAYELRKITEKSVKRLGEGLGEPNRFQGIESFTSFYVRSRWFDRCAPAASLPPHLQPSHSLCQTSITPARTTLPGRRPLLAIHVKFSARLRAAGVWFHRDPSWWLLRWSPLPIASRSSASCQHSTKLVWTPPRQLEALSPSKFELTVF